VTRRIDLVNGFLVLNTDLSDYFQLQRTARQILALPNFEAERCRKNICDSKMIKKIFQVGPL
jgi:hypothetical protein